MSDQEGPVVSVVVPVFDEVDNVGPLAEEIDSALTAWGTPFEIIFVDDGSRDGTRARLDDLARAMPRVRALAHSENAGQSRAIRNGVLAARGRVIMTLDGDRQNDPADAPPLLDQLLAHGGPEGPVGMVAGQRRERRDVWSKRIGSKIGNGIRQWCLKDGARDTGCALRMMWRDVYLRFPYFDGMHRFFAALVRREGYDVEFVDVSHRERMAGTSKYTNWRRLKVTIGDLQGVMWLRRRCRHAKRVDELGLGETSTTADAA